jgi:hypothetical protein
MNEPTTLERPAEPPRNRRLALPVRRAYRRNQVVDRIEAAARELVQIGITESPHAGLPRDIVQAVDLLQQAAAKIVTIGEVQPRPGDGLDDSFPAQA